MNNKGIAIDGPAGAGKTTIVKLIANKLGILAVDSGALYRTIAYCMIENDLDINDTLDLEESSLDEILDTIKIELLYKDGHQVVVLNGDEIEDSKIRTQEISMAASVVSTNIQVRLKVTKICQEVAENMEVIMEGRDICTVVMPNAKLKIYLDASTDVRANRRAAQLKEKGLECPPIQEIKKDIEKRDYIDMHKEMGALKKADDAIVIDTSNLNIEDVVKVIIDEYEKRK